MNIIGIDFSIAKPAACVFSNNKYYFFAWPKNINEHHKKLFESCKINIIKRENIEIDDITKYDIINADILSDLIIKSLQSFLDKDTYVVFEGTSFASKGNVTISLTAWRYILIYKLIKIVSIPIEHIFSYQPITIKSVAGCAKKGMKKTEMINEFIRNGPICKFRLSLFEKRELFMKRGERNWIDLVDDCVDSYFILETLRKKENL